MTVLTVEKEVIDNMWSELINTIYMDTQCESIGIYDCTSLRNDTIVKNAMLYVPDIIWELYYKYLLDDEKYIIDYADEEWKKYSPLLQNKHPEYSFDSEVGMAKSRRKRVTLLEYIHVDKCKVDENTITFPESVLIPFFILYLQNEDFFSLFIQGRKNDLKYGKNIIKFGNLLNEYDDYGFYGYTYERLTGVNIALLFANYFVKMIDCLGLPVCDYDLKGIEDEIWERNQKDYKERLKKALLYLLKKMMKFPMIFGRIVWSEIILHSFYVEEIKYIIGNSFVHSPSKGCVDENYIKKSCRLYQVRNGDIVEYMSTQIESFIREMEFKGFEAYSRICLYRELNAEIHQKFDDLFQMSNEVYGLYKELVIERLNEKKIKKDILWRVKDIKAINQWGKIKKCAEKIVSKRNKDTIMGYEDIGWFVKKDIKNNPHNTIPIIFIMEDIINKKGFEKDVNDFLTQALDLCKNK